VTVGVHGDWGAGKSSILEMIEGGLDNDGDILCPKFNGWRFQGFEDAKMAPDRGHRHRSRRKTPARPPSACGNLHTPPSMETPSALRRKRERRPLLTTRRPRDGWLLEVTHG
jgi:KAP family P-loop domain